MIKQKEKTHKEKFFKLISGMVVVIFFITSSASAAPFTTTTSLASTLRPSSAANNEQQRLLKELIASQRKTYMDRLSQSFDISAEEMLEIISEFEGEMARGLAGKASSLKILSAFISNPTGKEKGYNSVIVL